MVAAGAMSAKASRCASPYSAQREMSVTSIRVLTTSARLAPSPVRAAPTLAMAWAVWACASPSWTSSVPRTEVQPETKT